MVRPHHEYLIINLLGIGQSTGLVSRQSFGKQDWQLGRSGLLRTRETF